MMTKTWMISGVSAGLGRHMTETLLERGDRVVGSVRDSQSVASLQNDYPERFHPVLMDVTKVAQIRTAVAEAFEWANHIDVVVSNAGYGLFGAAEELGDEQIDRQIATNLTGSIQLIRAVLPHMRNQGGGRIVQVSSEGGQIAYPSFSLYHATKWGIEGFIEAVSQEVGPFGIDFIIAEPGPTGTNFVAGLDKPAPMPVYAATPAGDIRRAMETGSIEIKGDAARTVSAIIAAADSEKPALRLPLGSSAFEKITTALEKRLLAARASRDVAYSADRS